MSNEGVCRIALAISGLLNEFKYKCFGYLINRADTNKSANSYINAKCSANTALVTDMTYHYY